MRLKAGRESGASARILDRGLVSEDGYEAYVGRIARGVGVSSSGQGVGRLLGYATRVALARMHGPAQLGFYVLGITVVQVAVILAQFGMDNGVVRFVAHHGARRDAARVRGTIFGTLGAAFVLSCAISVAVFLGAGFLAGSVFGKPFLETMFRAFSAAIPFYTLMSLALWATQGFGTVKYATVVQHVVRPLVNLVLVVGFYFLGEEILGAVAAYVLSLALGSALALYALKRVFPELLDLGAGTKYEGREISAASGPMIVANLMQYANPWAAVVVLGIFEPAPVVGVYDAAARTAALSTLVLVAFSGVFSPMASSLYQRGFLRDLGYLYEDVSRWSFTAALAFFLATVLLAADVMRGFGEGFVGGSWVVVTIAAAQLFNSAVGPTARLLAMTGHQRAVMKAYLCSALAAAGLNLLLVPSFGIRGAAVATAAALVLANVLTLIFVRRRLGFWPFGWHYAKPIVAGTLAFTAVYGARAVFPNLEGLVAVVVFGTLFIGLFLALLRALGLSPSDQQFLGALWRTLRRSRETGR